MFRGRKRGRKNISQIASPQILATETKTRLNKENSIYTEHSIREKRDQNQVDGHIINKKEMEEKDSGATGKRVTSDKTRRVSTL